ncbi:MAG: zinc-ribbon domain-containing protein [Parabacteroides sp.]|nr:zinc-ribbon domain-containing protein [Parabacteroides sp.]
MKYCQHCGAEVNENAVVCVKCGCSIQQANNAPAKEVDNSVSAGLVILAVLIPLFGIIYWPVKAKERPKCARACGIAAIISWVVYILFIMVAGL